MSLQLNNHSNGVWSLYPEDTYDEAERDELNNVAFRLKVDVPREYPGENAGVRFNVETVPDALPKYMETNECKREECLYGLSRKGLIRLEAASCYDDDVKLISCGGNTFLVACVTAFAQHLPLGLSPDHI